jgi:PEP-CTERM motif
MKFHKSLFAASVLLVAFGVQAKSENGSFESKSQPGGRSISQGHWSSSSHFDITKNSRFDGVRSGEFVLAIGTLKENTETGIALDMAAVSAIPEPETYAMLLVGLGLIGTIVRRRITASKGDLSR